jgi:hypothetical protein
VGDPVSLSASMIGRPLGSPKIVGHVNRSRQQKMGLTNLNV